MTKPKNKPTTIEQKIDEIYDKIDALYDLFFTEKEGYFNQEELDEAIEALRNGDKKPLNKYMKNGGILPNEKEKHE